MERKLEAEVTAAEGMTLAEFIALLEDVGDDCSPETEEKITQWWNRSTVRCRDLSSS